MAITNPQPPIIDGKVYDLLGVSLALSTFVQQPKMVLAIAATFTPYRDTSEGPDVLEVGKASLVFGDAFAAAESDPALADFLMDLQAAAQRYINQRI